MKPALELQIVSNTRKGGEWEMCVLAKEIPAVPKDLCWPHHCFLR